MLSSWHLPLGNSGSAALDPVAPAHGRGAESTPQRTRAALPASGSSSGRLEGAAARVSVFGRSVFGVVFGAEPSTVAGGRWQIEAGASSLGRADPVCRRPGWLALPLWLRRLVSRVSSPGAPRRPGWRLEEF